MIEIKHKDTGKVIQRIQDKTLPNYFKQKPAVVFGVDLHETDLSGADLRRIEWHGADLRNANLQGANLFDAKLIASDVSGANLTNAYLPLAHFRDVDLEGTLLNGAYFGQTIFSLCLNLFEAHGLRTIMHAGPSTLDMQTLRANIEHLPDVFLEGVGYTQDEIDYFRAFFKKSVIEYYSCFISYSHKDEEFAKKLHSRLRDANIRVWYAREDMKAGGKIHEQIDQAIRYHDKLLLVISDNSLASEWVKTEIRNARAAEVKSGKRKLFPIRLCPFETIKEWKSFDADTGKDLGVEIREYFIPDFADWKNHDKFEDSFARLQNDLNAGEAKKA